MMNMKKGFTLIEMLSAILILGLLFLLVVPSIISNIRKATDDIDEATKKMIFSSSDIYMAKNSNEYPKTKGDVYCISIQELINSKELSSELVNIKTGKKIDSLNIIEISIENEANITYKIVNECEEIINEPEGPIYLTDDESGANHPFLLEGMTPIKWDDNNNEIVFDKDTDDNSWFVDWHDYENKIWANAKTEDGSYWVWIPRYAYKIGPNFHTSEVGIIDIKFLNKTTNESLDGTEIKTRGYNGRENGNNTKNNYFLHPAFIFGEDNILGFWVAKFEASEENGQIKSLPFKTSFTNQTVSEFFDLGLGMIGYICGEQCDDGTDTHMMKNIEWGAVAYLSRSQYGNPNELYNNAFKNGNSYQTGCAGTGVNATGETSCVEWNTILGQNASTTGNIYGVYDMKGGADEYVMGNYNWESKSSGFNNLVEIDFKYIDIYQGYEDAKNQYGDAIWETSLKGEANSKTSWYNTSSHFITSNLPWFIRGGSAGNPRDSAEGVFCFETYRGSGYVGYSFRPIAILP